MECHLSGGEGAQAGAWGWEISARYLSGEFEFWSQSSGEGLDYSVLVALGALGFLPVNESLAFLYLWVNELALTVVCAYVLNEFRAHGHIGVTGGLGCLFWQWVTFFSCHPLTYWVTWKGHDRLAQSEPGWCYVTGPLLVTCSHCSSTRMSPREELNCQLIRWWGRMIKQVGKGTWLACETLEIWG